MTTMLRRVLAVGLTSVLTGAAVLLGAPAATAADGLSASATSRYVLDARNEVVRATMTIDLRNISPDKKASDGVYTYYFDAYTVPVPAGARRVRAMSEGTALGVSVSDTDDPSTQVARIGFPNLTLRADPPDRPHLRHPRGPAALGQRHPRRSRLRDVRGLRPRRRGQEHGRGGRPVVDDVHEHRRRLHCRPATATRRRTPPPRTPSTAGSGQRSPSGTRRRRASGRSTSRTSR